MEMCVRLQAAELHASPRLPPQRYLSFIIMSTIAPLGAALLDCNATIKNPRAYSEDSGDLSLIFDALVLCYDEEIEANTPTVCNVRHKRASRNEILPAGEYRLLLTVWVYYVSRCIWMLISLGNVGLLLSVKTFILPVPCGRTANLLSWVISFRYDIAHYCAQSWLLLNSSTE